MNQGKERYEIRTLTRDEYRALLEGRIYPLYYAPWWLEIALEQKGLLLGCYEGDECLALFVAQYRYGELITPPFCQYTGILFLSDALSQYDKQMICRAIHLSLPSHTYLHINFPPTFGDWLGFHWLGYRQTTRYNYIWAIDSLETRKQILEQIDQHISKKINATNRAGFTYHTDIHLSEALTLLKSTATYKGFVSNWHLIEALILEGIKRQSIQIVGLRDRNGSLGIVSIFVCHQSTAYFIAGGCDRSVSKRYLLNPLLLMHYVLNKKEGTTHIDFEGSMLEPIAKMYQALGAKQHPYMTIISGQHPSLSFIWRRLIGK